MSKAGEMFKAINKNALTTSPAMNFEFPKVSPVVGMVKQVKRNEFNLRELF